MARISSFTSMQDIFVHINDCDESLDLLTKGQRVEFEEGSNPRTGKIEAKQINVIEASFERVQKYAQKPWLAR